MPGHPLGCSDRDSWIHFLNLESVPPQLSPQTECIILAYTSKKRGSALDRVHKPGECLTAKKGSGRGVSGHEQKTFSRPSGCGGSGGMHVGAERICGPSKDEDHTGKGLSASQSQPAVQSER